MLSVADVNALVVPDPENEPPLYDVPEGSAQDSEEERERAAVLRGKDEESGFHSVAVHACYLRRWQALLLDSDRLPAPARLALWLLWLRRKCAAGGGCGDGSWADPGGTPDSDSDGSRGVAFWRSYCASLPQPSDVTCLSVFTEQEAELLQVPGYSQQWRRTRDNLAWLLQLANDAAAWDSSSDEEEGLPSASASAPAVTARGSGGDDGDAGDGGCYSLEELCYCYALATSRCFHVPGRMLMVPFADLGNHQPLWQAGAFPFWRANGAYDRSGSSGSGDESTSASSGGGGGAGGGDGDAVSGWFEFRAVRDLAPGREVCICYSEGGNSDQLFSYGFVRQANPYDRVDLNPHQPWPPTQDADDNAWLQKDRLPRGFWAPRPDASALDAPQLQDSAADAGADSAAALEQSLLRPRGSAPLRMALGMGAAGGSAAERLRLQRRRSALLSLPHTAEDVEALRRSGLGWMASPADELRRWARAVAATEEKGEAGAGGVGRGRGQERLVLERQLADVGAVQQLVSEMQGAMATTLSYDEALWAALEGLGGAAPDAAAEAQFAGLARLGAAAAGEGSAGSGNGLPRALSAMFGGKVVAAAPAQASASASAGTAAGGGGENSVLQRYWTPRGRTALLARLEYKRVLSEAADVLATYRRAVESALR
ncbi:hypothetical protein GPECTOR_36g128 [Gonium pectorale]|uniref:SET domain-containing protein n=1 Tax=Gonium pectorale TaxID=33097 RepID=A0A150GBP7_GONPE|nr:hypothetical protein GPECTOR_36g128 [Gonium pectorale]|eukprot:KXZ47276.1 hypothetical protein GPECTOR_36g128 [Gonium pectorale]